MNRFRVYSVWHIPLVAVDLEVCQTGQEPVHTLQLIAMLLIAGIGGTHMTRKENLIFDEFATKSMEERTEAFETALS